MKLRVLLESLSYSEALKLFNLDKDYTENDVLKKYKRLAIKFHPDKGGDVEKMQDLNYAKDLLLKNVTKEYKQPESRESRKSDYEFLKKQTEKLCKEYFDNLNPDVFVEYFNEIFNDSFKYTVTDFTDYSIFYGKHVKFFNAGKTKLIDLDIWLRFDDVYSSIANGNLSSPDMKVTYETKLFIDGKRQRVKQKTYNDYGKKEIFRDPTIIFERKKLKAIAQGEKRKGDILKKRDFEYLFENKFGGKYNGDGIYNVPICNGEAYLAINRDVFMRVPIYRFCVPALFFKWDTKYKELAKEFKANKIRYNGKYCYETAETLAFFDKYLNILKNEDPNNLKAVLKLMFSEMEAVAEMSQRTYEQQ